MIASMEREAQRKLKRRTNRTIGSLVVYIIVMNAVMTLYMIVAQFILGMKAPDQTPQQVYEALMAHISDSGLPMFVSVFIGCLVLWVLMHRQVSFQSLFVPTEKKMTLPSFLMILCVFFSGQCIFSFMSAGLEAVANLLGYSLMAQIESATTVAESVSMFLYISFGAPILEELIFRGFILRGLQPLGRKASVIIAAIAFGLYHMNLPQALFAIYIGIVLGYVTTRYSIWWAIALHTINNLFAEVTGVIARFPALGVIGVLSSYLFIIVFIIGIVIVIQKREEIKTYLQQEKIEKGHLKCAFTGWAMILLMIICVAMAIPAISKL